MPPEPSNLAEQALANLVNQFARPLDFLRELAQNSIDAGSPRIDVTLAFDPPKPGAAEGVLRIGVDDYGEGMDEQIIDNQLTRLFSSTKEDDLTKIGKFGIGFTSIFAIKPEAVLLRTGRHGEHWELLFHADRSFDKVRITEPVDGTRITLFKRIAERDVPQFIEDSRFILSYWCEHSDTPIAFHDNTRGEVTAAVEGADPFAAFGEASAGGPELVNRPLDLDSPLWRRVRSGGLEVVIGIADEPRFGFYNGGLTLLNTRNLAALGRFDADLGHLAFKVKHDQLEHTLTRDNVLQDENWEHAMEAVLEARADLRADLVARTVEVARDGGDLEPWHRALTRACRTPEAAPFRAELVGPALFRDHTGAPLSLQTIREQERRVGCVLLGAGDDPLHTALKARKLVLVEDQPATRALLEAAAEPPLFEFLQRGQTLRRADEVFVLPALVDVRDLEPRERDVLARTSEILRIAVGLRFQLPGLEHVVAYAPKESSVANRLTLRVGDFGGVERGRHEVLALNGPRDGGVFLRPGPRWLRLPAFLQWRSLLINRYHPVFRAQVLASGEDPELAAYGLALALLHVEDVEGEAAYRRMADAVAERLSGLDGEA